MENLEMDWKSDDSAEKLREFLAKEEERLENLRRDIQRANDMLKVQASMLKAKENALVEEREAFLLEKERIKKEASNTLNELSITRKRLNEDKSMFDKKFKILEMSYKQLDADRQAFEAQKRAFHLRMQEYSFAKEDDITLLSEEGAGAILFFRGVDNPLALKKRYKDLIKIYHPDNLAGDKRILQQINDEYERLRKEISYQKKA